MRMIPMTQIQDDRLKAILLQHAKNLLRIAAVPARREVNEFRKLIRARLEEEQTDVEILLREIQDMASASAAAVAGKDPSLYEYYRAVYAETVFLLSALTTDRRTFFPPMAETA